MSPIRNVVAPLLLLGALAACDSQPTVVLGVAPSSVDIPDAGAPVRPTSMEAGEAGRDGSEDDLLKSIFNRECYEEVVCGTDGNTYQGHCRAQDAGVGVAHVGPC